MSYWEDASEPHLSAVSSAGEHEEGRPAARRGAQGPERQGGLPAPDQAVDALVALSLHQVGVDRGGGARVVELDRDVVPLLAVLGGALPAGAELAGPGEEPGVGRGLGGEAGAALVAPPLIRRVSFTGSTETARHIGVAAAQNTVPFTAELGGKNPFLVFEDADLDAALAGDGYLRYLADPEHPMAVVRRDAARARSANEAEHPGGNDDDD